MGEAHSGGLAQYARVPSSFLVKLPQNMTTRHAMCIGTAGYTAALCVDALEAQGVTPTQGEILVTGASGGVGSVAVALLSAREFSVGASTGKPGAAAYLTHLGASSIIDRHTLSEAGKPLQAERWAGVVGPSAIFDTSTSVLASARVSAAGFIWSISGQVTAAAPTAPMA